MARLFYVYKVVQIALAVFTIAILLLYNEFCHENSFNLNDVSPTAMQSFVENIGIRPTSQPVNGSSSEDYRIVADLMDIDNAETETYETVQVPFFDNRSIFYLSQCVQLKIFDGFSSVKGVSVDGGYNAYYHPVYPAKMVIRWVVIFGTIIFISLDALVICTIFVTMSKPTKWQNVAQCTMKVCPLLTVLGYLLIQDSKWASSSDWQLVGGAPNFPMVWTIAELILGFLILSVLLELALRRPLYAVIKFQRNTFCYEFDEASRLFEQQHPSSFNLNNEEVDDTSCMDPQTVVNKYAMAQHSFRSHSSLNQPVAHPRKFMSTTNTHTLISNTGSDNTQEKMERSMSTFGIVHDST